MCFYGQLKGKISNSSSITNSTSQNHKIRADLTMRAIWEFFPFVFRINDHSPGQTTLTILEQVCKERGWKEFGDEDNKLNGERGIWNWNLWWKNTVMNNPSRSLYSWQYTNHIPKAINFCNKEYLASYIQVMEDRFGDIFKFCPLTFTLPREADELEAEHKRRSELNIVEEIQNDAQNLVPVFPRKEIAVSKCSQESGDHHNEEIINQINLEKDDNQKSQKTFSPVWICKPAKKSQGKGIFVIDNLTNLPDHPITVVQEYISKPLLISKYKFDLRLYVTIVSVSPLTIYAYREGLTRFATEPYDLLDLSNTFSHLTNASLNKLSPGYEKDKTVVGTGCKWTLQSLRKHLQFTEGITDWVIWQKIMAIMVLSILPEIGQQVGIIPTSRNNFEFLGYDVLIDSNLRPWLLETNLSPGLGGDCCVDDEVKRPMLHELFTLLGLPDGRNFVHVVPTTAVKKNSENVIIDMDSNTTIQLSTEAELESESQVNGQNQVESAVKLIEKDKEDKKKKKDPQDLISPKLRKRLMDATAIYSQNLTLPLTKSRKKNKNSSQLNNNNLKLSASNFLNSFTDADETEAARLNFLASTDWIGTLQEAGRTCSSKSNSSNNNGLGGVGLQRRNWYDAPIQQGNWIRIFPFDSLSFQMTRGHLLTDIKAIVKNIEQYLNFIGNLTTAYPGQSDEFYNSKVNENINWNQILWLPPS